ncbi:MAG: hypothetical protein ACRDHE_14080, partial [Ktedonobacterales bacterium]
GYTMDYTMGVWAGNDNHSPMQRIDGVTGAAPIWHNSMMYAEGNLPKTPFPIPTGLQQATYTSNGITSTDWFLAGPLPPPNVGNGATGGVPCIFYNSDYTAWNYTPDPANQITIPGAGCVAAPGG